MSKGNLAVISQAAGTAAIKQGGGTSSLRVHEWDFSATWSVLKENIQHILRTPHVKPPREFIQLDRDVHKLTCGDKCLNVPQPEKLSDYPVTDQVARRCLTMILLLEETVVEHIHSKVSCRLSPLGQSELISNYVQCFEQYKLSMKLIQVIFRYLRQQAQRTRPGSVITYDTWQLGMTIWREKLFEPLQDQLMRAILAAIQSEREYPNSSGVTPQILRKALLSLITMSDSKQPFATYQKRFEEPFLVATETYCRVKVAKLEAASSVKEYMVNADLIIRMETRRAHDCCDRSTISPLLKILFKVFVAERLDLLFSKFDEWIDNPSENEVCLRGLKVMTCSSQSEAGLDLMRKKLEGRVEKDGLQEVTATIQCHGAQSLNNDPSPLMRGIFKVYSRYHQLVTKTLENHPILAQALDKGSRRFINSNEMWPTRSDKAAECLAKYVNVLLKPNSTQEYTPYDAQLAVAIFGLLKDKDVFQSSHGQYLATRLIYGQFNQEHENAFIGRVKEICGHDFTYKWQRMFTDATIHAPNLKEAFDNSIRDSPLEDPIAQKLVGNFSPMVLMYGSWPITGGESSAPPPPKFQPLYNRFTEFYTSAHMGRKLQFLPVYSWAVVRAFGKKVNGRMSEYELTVNHVQMMILLSIAESAKGSVPNEDLKKTLVPFSGTESYFDAQLAALISKEILTQQGPAVQHNTEMSFTLKKISLLQFRVATASRTTADADATQSTLSDRRYPIQAAIMRIMKSRKVLAHQDLIAEVIKVLQSRFTPGVAEIKANIDVLLEKDYMERNPDDASMYSYVV